MSLNYTTVKKNHNLLSAFVEMKDLESLLVKEAANAKGRTEHPSAKEIFSRWAHESEGHRLALQRAIEKLQGKTIIGACRACMEDNYAMSYGRARLLELLNLGETNISIIELHTMAKKHLIIEGDAERRYVQLAEMTDDEEIKQLLMAIAQVEKRHYTEAQGLVDVLEKTYGKIVKGK